MKKIHLTKKGKLFIKILSVCLILILVFIVYWFRNPFVSEITIEAGQEIKLEDLLKYKNARNPEILQEITNDITNKVGKHEITVKGNNLKHTVSINTVDTVAPEITTKTYTYYIGDDFDASKFIKKCVDETSISAVMSDEIDLNVEDTYKVDVVFSDEGNNTVTKTAKLIVKKDTEPPVIEAPAQIIVVKGDTVLYKKQVTINDNRDGQITDFEIDNSSVNLDKLGSYNVTYTASDKNGNKASKKVLVTVTSKEAEEAKADADKLAKEILDDLINDSMTNQEKLKKIYYYVRNCYTYVATHEGNIDDYYVDAYNGLKTKRGDCYVVNAMARILLDNCGIETIGVIIRDGNDTIDHISFMADTGDGWYHYCAFKKKSGLEIYKWTDSQFVAHCASSYHNSNVDLSSYPDTPNK